ncbi:hypothetical protein LIER_05847 [Lithospermum erythrorhizon]|uniref:Uncharacterized protein n=1 Tax=Lithospermum erythrorhizon TaxID=34254 RepID=A0AAV3P652_LITER
MSKEERVANRARRAEKKAREATEKAVEEEAVEDYIQEAEEQGSDEEDIAGIIIKRRKAKGKLKLNENRSKVGNKRIPKNVANVFTENVTLNSEEKKNAKGRFVASRRIIAERMLSENTKTIYDIMSILEDAGVMPTIETVDPYYPQLVREFICNMTEDIDESGTHVTDIPFKAVETGGGYSAGNDETVQFIKDEINHLEGVIQTSLARKSALETRLWSLAGEDDPVVDPTTSDSEAEASQE